MEPIDPAVLALMIDHTQLSATATADDIDRLCDEALAERVRTVCVNGGWVARCARRVEGSSVGVCSVIDFPLGAGSTAATVAEARAAIDDGATEIDVVIPIGRLIAGADDEVAAHLAAVREACSGRILKVIVESAVLDPVTLDRACELTERSGADFVKTSTGFHAAGGATLDAVVAIGAMVGERLGIKASGGIRTLADTEAMIDAGATRLGMSATVAVLAEARARA